MLPIRHVAALGETLLRRLLALGHSPLAVVAILPALLAASLACSVPAHADSLDAPQLDAPAAGGAVALNPAFTWDGVARAAKYRVQVSTTSAFTSIAWTADVFGTTATPTTELALGSLHWRAASIDGGGVVGPYSPSRAFSRVQAQSPAVTAPADGATLDYPADPAVLSWEPVAAMKQYRVEIDDEPTFTGASSYTTAATSFAMPAALPSNAPRLWRVQGVSTNSGVTTAWSQARTFAIAWPASAAPTPLTPADTLTQARDEIDFRWTAVPGAADYEIQTSTTEDFTAQLTTQVTDATRYRPTATLTQDQYYWRVRARQANAEPTAWSQVSRFKREWLDAGGEAARPAVTLGDTDWSVLGTQLEQGRISIAWTPVRRAAYYELEVSTDASFLTPSSATSMVRRTCRTAHAQWTPYHVGNYTGTTGFGPCAWTGTPTSAAASRFIVPGRTYYVRVRAVDLTPEGHLITTLWSNAAREGDAGAPPAATFEVVASTRTTTDAGEPAVLAPTPDSADTPMLSWAPVAGAQAYLVALALDSSFNNPVLPDGSFIVTANTELRLNQVLLDNSAGQPYFWFVLPCERWDAVGSAANVCNVGPDQAINVPGKYGSFNKLGKAVEGLAGDADQTDTVALAWQDQLTTSPGGGAVKWYELEVRNAANALVDTVTTDAAGYTPVDKTYADGPHSWRVRAIDASGTALAWSATASFQKRSSVPAPLAPAATATLPVLRWTPTSFAGSYDVEVYRGVDSAFPAASKVGAASATGRPYPVFTPAAALPADTYSWRVRQLDANGRPGPWSTTVLPFTVGGQQPALDSPADGAVVPATALVFRWGHVAGAVRYRLESSLTPGFGTISSSVLTTATSYAPTAAHAGSTTYHWRVSALNASDDTIATSDPRSFGAQTVPAATGASAAVSGAAISVSWTAPGNGGASLTGYVVRYRPSGTSTWTELVRAADVGSVALDGLPPNQKYEAQVAAQNAVGTGPFSTLVSATTPTVPAAPTSLKLVAAATGLTASWSPPGTGGSPITSYHVRVTRSADGAASETTVTAARSVLSGLDSATAYVVEVAARNAVGSGPYASVAGTTTSAAAAADSPPAAGTPPADAAAPQAPAVLTLAGAQTIELGRSATLTGALTSSKGVAIAAKAVTIEWRRAASAEWKRVSDASTTAGGAFSVSAKPTVNTQYRAVFAGAGPNLAAASGVVSVGVRPKLTLRRTATPARFGSTVVFVGSVLPKAARKTVALQCLRAGRWVTRRSAKTSAAGAFRLRVKLTSRTTLTCRAALARGPSMEDGRSPQIVVKPA